MPVKKSSLEQKWYFRMAKVLLLIFPLVVALIAFVNGKINVCNISPKNILELFQNNILYFAIGLAAYYIIITAIWRILLYIVFGGLVDDTKKKGSEATQSVNPVTQPEPVRPKPANIVGWILLLIVLSVIAIIVLRQLGYITLPTIDLSFIEHLNTQPTSETGLWGSSGAEGYQYWKGVMPNTYQEFNILGQPALQVTGIPFMVLTYDKISLDITDIEFGFSEVNQKVIPSDLALPPMPTLDTTIDFQEKLGLKSPIILLVPWNVQVPGGVGKSITNGVQEFSFEYPANGIGPSKNVEKWKFAYTSWDMMGGVTNLDTTSFLGRQSETNAFKLQKK